MLFLLTDHNKIIIHNKVSISIFNIKKEIQFKINQLGYVNIETFKR